MGRTQKLVGTLCRVSLALMAVTVCSVAQAQVATDDCASAPAIVAGQNYAGSTVGATTDGASTCGGGADVWYRFVAPGDGMVLIDTCGSALNTVLSVHSACPGDTSNQIACNDNATANGRCAGASATTSFICARIGAGQTWFVRIAGAAGATGAFALRVTFAPGSGITILNHGFQLSDGPGTGTPNWLFTMAHAIQKRVPCSQVAVYEDSVQQFRVGTFSGSGAWQPTANALVVNPALETILIFDWAVESGGFFKNDFRYEGWSEGAADVMIAAIVRAVGSADALDEYQYHFIGHSRGAVVNSEAVERLAGLGVAVDQMTTLDPHDWDQSGVPYDEDWRDWTLGLPQGPGQAWQSSWGFTTWSNITHSDNFYSTESTFLTPDGRPSGSRARELDVGALSPSTIDHSRVHAWYHGTIDLAATSDGDGFTFNANWWPGATRTTDGWNHSRLGGVARPGPTNGLLDYAPVWQPLADGVFNGDFQRVSPLKPDPIAGWYLHGGNQVEDTVVTEGGGNKYLELSAVNPVATHNRSAVPHVATHLRLRLLEDVALRTGAPSIMFMTDRSIDWPGAKVVSRGSAWTEYDYELAPGVAGQTAIFSVMLPVGATTMGVDDLRYVSIAPPAPCDGDADGSLVVNFDDITSVLANWLADYTPGTGPGDADHNGVVNFDDITAVLANWLNVCP